MTEFMQRLDGFAPFWGNAMWRAIWQGGMAIAVVSVLCLTFPKVSARMRCWWWRLAFAKLLLCLFWATPVKLALLPAAKPMLPVVRKLEVAHALPPIPFSALSSAAEAAKISISRHEAKPGVMCLLLILWVSGVTANSLGIARQWWLARRLITKSSSQICGLRAFC